MELAHTVVAEIQNFIFVTVLVPVDSHESVEHLALAVKV